MKQLHERLKKIRCLDVIMRLEQVKKKIASNMTTLRKKYKVRNIGIFGSYSRNEQKKTSDVDILVRFYSGATLFDFVGLGNYLEEMLKLKVDLVSESGIRPKLRKNILKGLIKV